MFVCNMNKFRSDVLNAQVLSKYLVRVKYI